MKKGGEATWELARRYFELFVNRAAYTLQSDKPDVKGKHYYYRPKGELRLNLRTILKHLLGDITIGLYAINPKTQRSKWIAIDADYTQSFEHLLKIKAALRKDGVESALERSRRGAHLWVFAASPLLSRDCRLYVYNLAHRLQIPVKLSGASDGIEVFPRQDQLNDDEFGNAIRGPLGVHRGAGKKRFWFYDAHFNVESQILYIERLDKLAEPQLHSLIEGLEMPEPFRPRPQIVLPPYDPSRPEFRILEHVGKGRRSGKDYRTRCPSCGVRDKNSDNLAISIVDPRKYRCWAGCSKEEIRAALGCPIRPRMETHVWQPRMAHP